jgi:hypothetical protein
MLVNSTQVAALYESLHVTKFNPHSDAVEKMFKPDFMVDYSYYYDYLIFNRFPTILNGAEYDNRDGAKGLQIWMKTMLTKLRDSYWEQEQKIYHFEDKFNATRVGGYYKQQDRFTYITLPKSGHMFTYFNYDSTTAQLADLIASNGLTCLNCSTVAEKCKAMNDCNGNGKCGASNGVCTCNTGFKGADCSYTNTDLSRESHKIVLTRGDQFVYFTVPFQTQAWTVSITSSSRDYTLYLKDGQKESPNQFNYDNVFKKWPHASTLTLSGKMFGDGDMSGAIWVHGFEELTNSSFKNRIQLNFHASAGSASEFI